LRADRGSTGGWGGRPVGEEELLGSHFEARIWWDNPRDRGQVVCHVEGDGRQSDHIMDEGDGRVG